MTAYKRATRIRPVAIRPSTVATVSLPGPTPLAAKVMANVTKRSESRHLRLSNTLWERVRACAQADRRTCANMVQVLLEEALERRKQ